MKSLSPRQRAALGQELFGKDKVRTDRAVLCVVPFQHAIDHKYWWCPTIIMITSAHLDIEGGEQMIDCVCCDTRWNFSHRPAALLAVKYLPTRRREVRGICLACMHRPDIHLRLRASLTRDFALTIKNCSSVQRVQDLD